jgi:hypothetical protein
MNIIPLRRQNTLEFYFSPMTPQWDFAWRFVLAIVLTVILPRIIFVSYFGSLAAIILAAVGVIGVSLGVRNYFRPLAVVQSCVPRSTVVPSRLRFTLKRAA